ncbi:hypothetical protein HYALB_00013339 [Hymenoscyphus albidus]|uniref:Uncharacterized protein n=1 Tax=Hymenoscyphus albidus TaxID=595503 RepID=A0A9N9LXL4_9HELO|nr:hypothetical protein HYALB_00013339 [Hymenoscyphus albidus]
MSGCSETFSKVPHGLSIHHKSSSENLLTLTDQCIAIDNFDVTHVPKTIDLRAPSSFFDQPTDNATDEAWLELLASANIHVTAAELARITEILPLPRSYPSYSVIANITIWSTIEPACSVIAACLPTFGPLSQKGRSPESLVASIGSVLSLRSFSSSLATEKRGKVSQEKISREDEESRAGWAKHNGAGSTTVESGAHSDVVPKRGEIIMEKSFSSE